MKTTNKHQRINAILSAMLVLGMLFGAFSLTACTGGSDKQEEQEQDNCYGDDMPVVNE